MAGWSSDKEMTELKASLETIQATAKELINEIEGHFTELQQKRQAEQEQGDTFSIYQLKRCLLYTSSLSGKTSSPFKGA